MGAKGTQRPQAVDNDAKRAERRRISRIGEPSSCRTTIEAAAKDGGNALQYQSSGIDGGGAGPATGHGDSGGIARRPAPTLAASAMAAIRVSSATAQQQPESSGASVSYSKADRKLRRRSRKGVKGKARGMARVCFMHRIGSVAGRGVLMACDLFLRVR